MQANEIADTDWKWVLSTSLILYTKDGMERKN